MKREHLAYLAVGVFAGFLISFSFDYVESQIPPTNALQIIEVLTSPWAGQDTNVTADSYNDRFYFVSDGSILFNVTETYP